MTHNVESNRSGTSVYVNVFMLCVFVLLVSFALWLVWVTYFREFYDAGVIEVNYKAGSIGVLSAEGAGRKNLHYHNQTELGSSGMSTSACIVCHGDFPHSESRSVRAFLNAHAYVMTCEVCHLAPDEAENLTYRWLEVDSNTVAESREPDARYKALPIVSRQGEIQRFDQTENLSGIRKYVEQQSTMTDAFREAIKKETHTKVSEEAVSCHECHNIERAPHKLYADLAYSQERMSELRRIEVAGMIHKYQEFYMPSLLHESE